MIWRVHDRQTFAEFRRSRHRVRCGTLMLTRVPAAPDVATPPRVAFAIGAKLGSAVARNRVRRRLRAAFSSAAAEGRVPPGAYLAVVRPEAISASFAQLEADVTTLLAKLTQMSEGTV